MKMLLLLTCHNRKIKTQNCIDSLIKDCNIDWKFIVVDDNSKDGTYEMLLKYPQIDVIKGDGNCFYSGGMRIAIAEAKKRNDIQIFDYIMLFNDDVEFYPKAITHLIQYLNGENAIMVGATQDRYGKLSYGGVMKRSKFRPKLDIVMSKGNNKLCCDTLNANCVLISTKIFLELDNIDLKYKHSLGDYDYGFAASRKGYKINVSNFYVGICDDNALKNTWNDKTLSRMERLVKKESIKGQPWKIWFYFINKNYNLISACFYSVIPYIKICIGK